MLAIGKLETTVSLQNSKGNSHIYKGKKKCRHQRERKKCRYHLATVEIDAYVP